MCFSLKLVSLGLPWWSRIHLSMQGSWVRSLVRELCVCAQSCPTPCNSMNCSPPGFSVHGLSQASILEWVAISFSSACMHAKLLRSCLTLCNPMDCSLSGFSVHGSLQARILEWVVIPFIRGSSQPRNRTQVSCIGRQILYH